jgi:nicotinate-nucleotide adenylyltransferase
MTTARRIGILGGTFDPIHLGHIDLARAAEATLDLTRLFVIPASVPPHRPQTHASSFHRFAMAALVVADHPNWRASDLELRSLSTSYTAVTLQQFHDRGYVPSELYFIIGADAFADLATWRAYPQILDWAHFAVISRPGHPADALPLVLPTLASRMVPVRPTLGPAATDPSATSIILIDAPTAAVSSTAIRERRATGESIAGLVTPGVETHIERHGLYAALLPITPGIPWTPGRRGNDPPSDVAAGRLHGQG